MSSSETADAMRAHAPRDVGVGRRAWGEHADYVDERGAALIASRCSSGASRGRATRARARLRAGRRWDWRRPSWSRPAARSCCPTSSPR